MSLERTYREALETLPGVLSFTEVMGEKPSLDHHIVLCTDSGYIALVAEIKRSHLTKSTAAHLIAASKQHAESVLVMAPHIGADLAAEFVAAGLNYLDARGNCHIAVPPFFVHIEGKTGPTVARADKGLRAAGYKVLFAYLADARLLDGTVRYVAEQAGVSRQPVSDMRRRLIEEGYVLETKTRARWAPRRRQDGLSLWLSGYETTVRPSLLWGSYRTQTEDPVEVEDRVANAFAPDDVRWGGSAAGFRMAGWHRGARTVAHVRATPTDVRKQLRAVNDTRGNLVLMNAFGDINWNTGTDTVHALLVYSEMLAEKSERVDEAAQMLYERYIQSVWEQDEA